MADPQTVMNELLNNNDLVVVYDGAQGLFPEGGRRTGSLRYALFKMIWDLMRFQKPSGFKWVFNPEAPVGMRDQVSRIHLLTEQNNWILTQLGKEAGLDMTKLPGA